MKFSSYNQFSQVFHLIQPIFLCSYYRRLFSILFALNYHYASIGYGLFACFIFSRPRDRLTFDFYFCNILIVLSLCFICGTMDFTIKIIQENFDNFDMARDLCGNMIYQSFQFDNQFLKNNEYSDQPLHCFNFSEFSSLLFPYHGRNCENFLGLSLF